MYPPVLYQQEPFPLITLLPHTLDTDDAGLIQCVTKGLSIQKCYHESIAHTIHALDK